MSRVLRWVMMAVTLWTMSSGQSGFAHAASASESPPSTSEQAVPAAWRQDVWYHVTPGTPLFSSDPQSRHSAAVLQSDGAFAHFVLGTPEQGALVSVGLPGQRPSDTLTSDLIMPAGNVLSRKVTGAQLVATPETEADQIIYSFRIAPADIELFMAAARWRLKTGDTQSVLTLKGSRKAISAALDARSKRAETMKSEP